MAAQDVTNAATGAVGDAGNLVATLTDWVITNGPGLALKIVSFLAILIIGFWIAKKLSAAAKKVALKSPNVDETLANFLSSIVGYVVKIMVLIAAITHIGVEATSLVAILGAATLAIGLALQGTLGNVAASISKAAFGVSLSIIGTLCLILRSPSKKRLMKTTSQFHTQRVSNWMAKRF